jgi:hypothetical protein
MLLITNCLELGVVAGISRTLAGRQHAVSGRPMLIHTYHTVPMLFSCRHPATTLPWPWENAFRKTFVAWQGNGMECVNQRRPHYVNQMGKTRPNGLAQRFPNFFQVGTTFISQNVLRTALLLSPLKAHCLRFSTTVCDTQFTLILFFLSF